MKIPLDIRFGLYYLIFIIKGEDMKDPMQIWVEPKRLIIDINAAKNSARLYKPLGPQRRRFLIFKKKRSK